VTGKRGRVRPAPSLGRTRGPETGRSCMHSGKVRAFPGAGPGRTPGSPHRVGVETNGQSPVGVPGVSRPKERERALGTPSACANPLDLAGRRELARPRAGGSTSGNLARVGGRGPPQPTPSRMKSVVGPAATARERTGSGVVGPSGRNRGPRENLGERTGKAELGPCQPPSRGFPWSREPRGVRGS